MVEMKAAATTAETHLGKTVSQISPLLHEEKSGIVPDEEFLRTFRGFF